MAGDRGRRGFTLVEIMIAVAILGILVVLAVSTFKELNEKYRIEGETKQLYADLMDVRARAMQRNRFTFVQMRGDGYATFEDCNPEPDGNCNFENGLDNQVTRVTVSPHTIVTTLAGSTDNLAFNRNGIATDTGTIQIISPLTTVKPDYDCITIGATRIKMGAMVGGSCVEK
jgi:prepilin-type N-terminal cleavage/methylation domain-containing protein